MRTPRPLLALATVALATPLLTPRAHADVLLGNLASAAAPGIPFGAGSLTVDAAWAVLVDGGTYRLEGIELALEFPNPGALPQVALWSDAGGAPGAPLLTLTGPGNWTGSGAWTFSPPTPFDLLPGTTYWLHVSSVPVGGPLFEWSGGSDAPSGLLTAGSLLRNGTPSALRPRFELRGTPHLSTYCSPVGVHSGGGSVDLSPSSLSGPTGLHLEAHGGPVDQFGYFLASIAPLDPGVAVGQGFVCVAAPQHRYAFGGANGSLGRFDAGGVLQNVAGTSSVGSGFDVPDLASTLPGGALISGQTYRFQLWYRDGPHSNWSNGLAAIAP